MKGKALVFPAIGVLLFTTMCGSGRLQGKPAAPQQPAADRQVALLDENFGPMTFPAEWPSPAPRPAGTPAEAARALAKRALAGGPDVLAVLERVALDSGFAIHDQRGKYIYLPAAEVDNGISIQDLDLVTAAEGLRRKAITTYGDLRSEAETQEPTKGFPVEYLLSTCSVEGSGHPKGPNPGRAFMTEFLLGLSEHSDGLYDLPANWAPDTALSSAHACFILYTAMAAAYAGSTGQDAESLKPADNLADGVPPAEDPPPVEAEEPPPHGPRLVQQNAANAAFRDLRQVITNFSNDQIAQHIRNNPRHHNAHTVLLFLARHQAIKNGVSLQIQISNPPLVRTKTFGQTGEKRGLSVTARFQVSDDFRNRYEALRQYVQRGGPLPSNGFLACDVFLEGDDLVTVDPGGLSLSDTGTVERTMAIGARQDKKLPNTPKEDDKEATLTARVRVDQILTGRKLKLPVRDWLQGGMWLKTAVYVNGQGVEPTESGGTFRWYIARTLKQKVLLENPFPQPVLGAAFDVQDPDRYMSWMTNLDPTKVQAEYEYKVDDLYIWEGPAGGCGVKDGARGVSVFRVTDRKPLKVEFRQDILERDSRKNAYSFHTGLVPIPVTKTTSGSDPATASTVDTEMSVLEEIGPNTNLAVEGTPFGSEFELDRNLLKVKGMGKTGGVQYHGKAEVASRMGHPRYARVRTTWEILEQDNPAGAGKKRPLSNEQLASLFVSAPTWEGAGSRPLMRPAVHGGTPGRGPLWVSDPHSATCTEIDLNDEFPPSVARSSS